MTWYYQRLRAQQHCVMQIPVLCMATRRSICVVNVRVFLGLGVRVFTSADTFICVGGEILHGISVVYYFAHVSFIYNCEKWFLMFLWQFVGVSNTVCIVSRMRHRWPHSGEARSANAGARKCYGFDVWLIRLNGLNNNPRWMVT